ncbi:FxSxx-COOH system tetratricopeptide repeat protein [Actinoplanes sp. NPDC023936]|uniref:FxSxx-COOH system tetratricopeptide repeat protein n=1 Tax=Actinoplanes sp. NPDC023936 TaxID=3154910 RepID=UPI0033F99C47
MTEHRHGKVVTFYSFKGGTGRTMALANVAWILAANGKRVLVADWDLESPGLHRFFAPFMKPGALETTGGIIDMIRTYEMKADQAAQRKAGWHRDFARVHRYAFSLDWDHFPGDGQLDFISAGRQNQDYATTLTGMNWDDFYGRLEGGEFLDALGEDMRAHYDYTLIDSRTGLSDVADICTIQLPDTLVDCFTFAEQGIDGAAKVAASIEHKHARRGIRILPVPMRVDPAEKEKADAGRSFAMQRFPGLPAGMGHTERRRYWNAVEVPYRPFYAYEEILATFGDSSGQATSLLAAYERLTAEITRGDVSTLPELDETLRARTVARFVRQVSHTVEEVTLHYAPEDSAWAEWVGSALAAAGLHVHEPDSPEAAADGGARITLISHNNPTGPTELVPRDRSGPRPARAVYVDDLSPLPNYPAASSAFLSNKTAEQALERVLRLVGRTLHDVDPQEIGVRYPGTPPVEFQALARNARFTGREADLRDLRSQLRGEKKVVLSGAKPVALQGMGGIGKTQVALEYAHRFKNAYDVVWWIDAEQVTFIDISLADLGERLQLPLPQSSVTDKAMSVIGALEQGTPHPRWLLIFDNAEEIEQVQRFVPDGPGHVLITSRNTQWGDYARPVQIDVFQRRESIAHLRQRVTTIRPDQANQVAEALGDLPIAVAATGAWLAETGEDVTGYLRRVEQAGPDSAVDEVWNLSLELLEKRSKAAYRLLQLCSVLAPEISLDLIQSDELAGVLSKYDRLVSERAYRLKLVQHINKLALLKLDRNRSQIQVHRLLQHVLRKRMTAAELSEARHDIHVVLAGLRPRYEIDDSRSWERFRMLWPHLELSEAATCGEELVRQLMIDRVRYLWYNGGLQEGRDLGDQIDKRWTRMLKTVPDPETRETLHRQILHLRFNVANILRQMAHFDESLALDAKVLEEQLDLLGPTHPHTLMTAGGLAADLRAVGRYAEARERDEQTYATWMENFGDDAPRTLMALSNLATTHRLAGDFRAARALDQDLWDRNKEISGETHPLTLSNGTNLGRDLREAGDYQRSVEVLEEIAAQYAEVFGPTTDRTLSAKANLAVSLRSAGRPERAAELLEEVYEQLNEVVGPSNPDTLACRLSRAVSLLAIGAVPSAISEFEEVRRTYGDSLGRRHPHTLICLNNLAAAHRAAGDLTTALGFARDATRDLGDVLGPEHPYTLAASLNLAILHAETSEIRTALSIIEPTMRAHRDVLGPEHPDTLRCAVNQAMMRLAAGEPASAEDGYASDRLIAALGTHHPAVVAMREGRYLHRMLDPHPF